MLYATVLLFGREGGAEGFHAYEEKALAIFRKHGGTVVAAYAPKPDAARAESPDEIQFLVIADSAAFDRFLKDPARTALASERDAVIRKTEVFLSERAVSYG